MDQAPYTDIERDKWLERDQYRVIYASPEQRNRLMREVLSRERFDCIYLNSFFSVGFTVRPLIQAMNSGLLSKVVMAPRGMLGEGALSLKSGKKRVFIQLFKRLGVHRKIRFHSTDSTETNSIRRVLGDVAVTEVSNVPVTVDPSDFSGIHSPVKLVFASRISPKKQLDFLLRCVVEIDQPFQLDIYGAADDSAYLKQCESLARYDDRIRFMGAVPPVELKKVLRDSDFFCSSHPK